MIDKFKLYQLSFENMSFQTGGYEVFKNITIDLPCNEAIFISGQEGSGKSMILKILAGLAVPQSGQYLINGQDVLNMSFEEFLPFRLNIGYSFDMNGLLSNKTIRENLTLPLEYHRWLAPDDIKKRVDELLEYFNLHSVADLRPSDAPGSTRKAACVARAFVLDPEILILDQPTVGLSKTVKERLIHLLRYKWECGAVKHILCASSDVHLAQEVGTKYLDISKEEFCIGDEVITNILQKAAGE